jgi:hypothetical protein
MGGPPQAPKSGPIQETKLVPKPGRLLGQPTKVWKPIGPQPNKLVSDNMQHIRSGSGSSQPEVLTQLPKISISNNFSVFQVGELSGTCENPSSKPIPSSVACTEVSPQADSCIPLDPRGLGPQFDGTIVPHAITAPLSEPIGVDRTWCSSSE